MLDLREGVNGERMPGRGLHRTFSTFRSRLQYISGEERERGPTEEVGAIATCTQVKVNVRWEAKKAHHARGSTTENVRYNKRRVLNMRKKG
mgnify:CR=1 FL=1